MFFFELIIGVKIVIKHIFLINNLNMIPFNDCFGVQYSEIKGSC